MKIFESLQPMQAWSLATKNRGEKIAFVPTMGALHEGHAALLSAGKKLGDKLVLSIFVNPLQFGLNEDFHSYPRDREKDLAVAKNCGVDAVFLPTSIEMYPKGFQTAVEVEELSKPLCSPCRPGHFRGVATVVLKLFNIVQPDVALFGEKDWQQLKIIQRLVHDLSLPMEIIPVPTVREDDGLAISSRNQYLTKEERQAGLSLSLSLAKAQAMVDQRCKEAGAIIQMVKATLEETKKIKVDYVSICHPETLQELQTVKKPALLAIACFIGKTRLIDNVLLK